MSMGWPASLEGNRAGLHKKEKPRPQNWGPRPHLLTTNSRAAMMAALPRFLRQLGTIPLGQDDGHEAGQPSGIWSASLLNCAHYTGITPVMQPVAEPSYAPRSTRCLWTSHEHIAHRVFIEGPKKAYSGSSARCLGVAAYRCGASSGEDRRPADTPSVVFSAADYHPPGMASGHKNSTRMPCRLSGSR